MKIKLFIVTYKNNKELSLNIKSLLKSDWSGHHLEINILNNHSGFYLEPELAKHVRVLDNVCRPDFSTGHLSRSWNQAIVNGFQNITNPDCDILAHCQDDTLFEPDWVHTLVEYHKKYSFIQMGAGDNFCSYTIDAIKSIGIWDERFCGIGFQEGDYFLRAWIYNRDKSSINDEHHVRILNPVEKRFCKRTSPFFVNNKLTLPESHLKSMKFHSLNKALFMRKWNIEPEDWNGKLFKSKNPPSKSLIENYITYPYFELEIPNLKDKGYFVEGKDQVFFEGQ